jgi:hypothetical protein
MRESPGGLGKVRESPTHRRTRSGVKSRVCEMQVACLGLGFGVRCAQLRGMAGLKGGMGLANVGHVCVVAVKATN